MNELRSILIFRNGSIGNTIVAIPAMRAIRERFREARIAAVVDAAGYELLEPCPWIDELIVYDKRGRDAGFGAYWQLVRRLRSLNPDCAVLFKRFFRNGLLSYLSGASIRAGFRTQGRAPFLNRTVDYDEQVHVRTLNLRLATLIGAEDSGSQAELFTTDADREQAQAELKRRGVDSAYIILHYGGATIRPDFLPISRFRQLLKELKPAPLPVVLIGSGDKETAAAKEIGEGLPDSHVAVNLPLRVTSALIEAAVSFVGFDSGPAHICSATHTPGIVIYEQRPGIEQHITRWRPWSDRIHTVIAPQGSNEAEWADFIRKCAELHSPIP